MSSANPGPHSKSQLDELNADLVELEESIQELLNNTEGGTKPVKLKDNIGRLSRMDEMHTQSILVANRNVLKNRLKQIKLAKLRFNEKTYGTCIECDEQIAFPRLKAYPEAAMCIVCKSEAESED
jgi:DnaK suppressor protein